jgi:DNA-binding NtrC family response regulator
MAKVVIIDDESSILELMSKLCKSVGHTVYPCLTGTEGLAAVRAQKPELVIVDLRIGDISGLDIVKTCTDECPDSAVIMVTGHGSVETAVEAMRLGAFDYLTKPFDLGDLIKTVNQALARTKPAPGSTPAINTSATIRSSGGSKLIGHSEAIQKIFELVRRVADTDSPILVEGEFGVGKHMLARAVHEASKRSALPFKELQCSALPEDVLEAELFGSGNAAGIFQRANGGIVHLAEIHQLPPRIQAQLNSFLDEAQNRRSWSPNGSSPSFRLITSTTASLEEISATGRFREDLYYKISVVPVRIPPLRDRREDIRPLVEHFLRDLSERTGSTKSIDANALEFLERYPWPGNISELRNAVERACALCEADRIRPSDLPTKVSQQIEVPSPAQGGSKVQLPIGSPLDDFIKAQERLFIQETLKYNNGSREKTASMLAISIATLYRKMGLNVERKTTS